MKKMVTATGIEHGLINTLINQVPKSKRFKNVDPKKKEELEMKVKRDSELETVRFIHYKNQENGHLPKDYSAGAGEPIFMFNFLHDHVYTVPKGLIDQVNDTSRLSPKREGSLDENGQPRAKDGPVKRLYQFVKDI